jgi:hypothetical protein
MNRAWPVAHQASDSPGRTLYHPHDHSGMAGRAGKATRYLLNVEATKRQPPKLAFQRSLRYECPRVCEKDSVGAHSNLLIPFDSAFIDLLGPNHKDSEQAPRGLLVITPVALEKVVPKAFLLLRTSPKSLILSWSVASSKAEKEFFNTHACYQQLRIPALRVNTK